MRFLAFGDSGPERDFLDKMLRIDFSSVDFLLFTGDLATTPDMWHFAQQRVLKQPSVLDKKDVKTNEKYIELHNEKFKNGLTKYKEAVKQLVSLSRKVPIYGVFGNADLEAFVSQTEILNCMTLLHKRSVEVNGYHLVGYSGEAIHLLEETYPDKADVLGFRIDFCRFNTHAFKETEVYNDLSGILNKADPRTVILVTHSPPYGILDNVLSRFVKWATITYGERGKNGNIGSTGLAKVDSTFHPFMHIFGHVDENKGVLVKENTIFINTGGCSKDGEVVDVETSNHRIEIRFKKVDYFISAN